METLTVKLPNYTIGEDAIYKLSKIVDKYGNRVLIVGGKTALEKTKDKILTALNKSNTTYHDFMWYGGECTYHNMEEIKNTAQENDFNLIISVGGGKAIDTAKGAAEKIGIPNITIPTIASTCAATTALSVVYTEKGDFDSIYLLKNTPKHILIDTKIIAESPWRYQWAGIGDTLAKYYEVDLASRNKKLSYSPLLGKEISYLCKGPLVEYGEKALKDNKNKETSFELEQVILSNIINTGLVSLLVGDENNGAAAHGLFYGMTLLEEIEKNHLHGEVIAYGILVMLMMDGNKDEVLELCKFYKKINLPTCLADIGLGSDDMTYLEPVIEKALDAPDMKKMPCEITKDKLLSAILALEKLNK